MNTKCNGINENNKYRVVVFLLIALLGFLHLFRLNEVPFGINIDEAGASYDALCIANYGTDRYGNAYPVYFINYGGGQNALLTYILAILYKIFGYHASTVRLVMSAACFVTAFFGYKLFWEYFENRWYGIAFLALFTISPIYIMLFRVGVESTLMLCAATVFLFLLTKSVKYKSRKCYFLTGAVAGTMLYTYALAYIVLPIMLVLMFGYMMYVRKEERLMEFKRWCIMGFPMSILAAPLIVVQVINIYNLPQMRIGPFTLTKLPAYRSAELAIGNIPIGWLDTLRYTLFYDDLPYNTIASFGIFYYISIPFILCGFVWCVRKLWISIRTKRLNVVAIWVFWYFAEILMGSMLVGASKPYTSCMNGIFVVLLCFLTAGIIITCNWVQKKFTKRMLQKFFIIATGSVYAISFVLFANYYFGDYTEDTYPLQNLFAEDYSEVIAYNNGEGKQYSNYPLYLEHRYIYYALPAQINPAELGLTVAGATSYGNVRFGYPDDIDYNGNYAVYKREYQSRDYLLEKGYREQPLGEYYIYISPICDLKQQNFETETVVYQIDVVTCDKEGNLIIAGWAYQNDKLAGCEQVTLKCGSQTIAADLEMRPDVAEAYGLSEDGLYGFRSIVDKEIFKSIAELSVYAEDVEIYRIEK